MVSMFDDYLDSDLEEHENDITIQRSTYQLHHQKVFLDDENYDKDKVCITSSTIDHINLRIPSKEEIDKITAQMISQVHSNYDLRSRTIGNDAIQPSSIFIKDTTHKMEDDRKLVKLKYKKWIGMLVSLSRMVKPLVWLLIFMGGYV